MPLPPMAGDEQRLLRMLVNIASFMAFIVVIACLYWGQTVLIPVAMALLLAFLLKPVVELFQWTGLGRTLSVILVVVVTGIVFAGLGWVVTAQVTRLAYDLGHNPQYKEHIEQKLTDLRGLGKAGVLDNFQAIINTVMRGPRAGCSPRRAPRETRGHGEGKSFPLRRSAGGPEPPAGAARRCRLSRGAGHFYAVEV
jgi:predicted PurR-regulated permease PerM